MKSNEEYWKERFTLLNEQLLEQGEQYNKKLAQEYDKASNDIQKEIEVFYARFAVNNLITFAEAKRIMNSDERKIFQMEVREYIEKGRINALNQKWIKELENASTIYRTDHLKALKIKIRQQVELLEAAKEKELKSTLANIYEEGYYKTAYEVQKGIQAGLPVAALDTNQVEKVLAKPWTADGRTFSAKIWGNDRVNLINQLETKLAQAFIKGEAPEKLIEDIVKTMQVSKSAASRLVMTESAFFASASHLDSYKAIGIEKFQILSALDSTTCESCGSLDGKVIPLSEYMPGTTAPPFHPWCRCTTIPYFKDEFTAKEKRLARGEDGRAYKVPGDITYQQWKEKYITNTGKLSSGKAGDTDGYSVIEKVGNIDYTNDKEIQKLFKDFAEDVKANRLDKTIENAIVVTKDNKVYHIRGNTGTVGINLVGAEDLAGAKVIHNHPDFDSELFGDCFSKDDFSNFFRYQLNEMQVYSGKGFFSMTYSGKYLKYLDSRELYEEGLQKVRENAMFSEKPIEYEQLEVMKVLNKKWPQLNFKEMSD